jgi:hypothetical protein
MSSNYFKRDLSDSANAFINTVWPTIKKWFDRCEIRHVETVNSIKFVNELDQLAGIDAWVLKAKTGMRGLASRVQWETSWNTFTIRRQREFGTKTEFEKRKEAIEKEWLYPYYTVQAYISRRGPTGEILSVACCKTKDLIEYISDGIPKQDYKIREVKKNGSANFYVVKWDDFQELYPIDLWDQEMGYHNYSTTLLKDKAPKKQIKSMEGFF